MAAGGACSADFLFELNDSTSGGLLMGDGTSYEVISVSGLEAQELKVSTLDLLGDGEVRGVDRLAARDAALTLEMYHATPGSLQTLWAAFMSAWAPAATQPLYWRLSGAKRYVNGRTDGWVPDYSQRTHGIITVVARFRITDPVIHT